MRNWQKKPGKTCQNIMIFFGLWEKDDKNLVIECEFLRMSNFLPSKLIQWDGTLDQRQIMPWVLGKRLKCLWGEKRRTRRCSTYLTCAVWKEYCVLQCTASRRKSKCSRWCCKNRCVMRFQTTVVQHSAAHCSPANNTLRVENLLNRWIPSGSAITRKD